MTSNGVEVYLSLGSNIGDREDNLRKALKELSAEITIEKRSPVYETEPKHILAQPLFLNMALKGATNLSARELLQFIKKIEQEMGRLGGERFGPRIIDIDILFYGQEIVDEPDLVIPHPRLALRAFVLAPLNDIAPDLRHPILKVSVRELLKSLGDISSEVIKTSVNI